MAQRAHRQHCVAGDGSIKHRGSRLQAHEIPRGNKHWSQNTVVEPSHAVVTSENIAKLTELTAMQVSSILSLILDYYTRYRITSSAKVHCNLGNKPMKMREIDSQDSLADIYCLKTTTVTGIKALKNGKSLSSSIISNYRVDYHKLCQINKINEIRNIIWTSDDRGNRIQLDCFLDLVSTSPAGRVPKANNKIKCENSHGFHQCDAAEGTRPYQCLACFQSSKILPSILHTLQTWVNRIQSCEITYLRNFPTNMNQSHN